MKIQVPHVISTIPLLLCLLLIIIIPKYNFCQEETINGAIIQDNSDTINGEIHVMKDIKMMGKVKFRTEGSMDFNFYKPNDISAFFFGEDNYFKSLLVDNKQIFLRCLIEGYYSLYDHPDVGIYYLRNNNDSMIILNNTYKMISFDGQTYKKYQKEYIIALKNEMNDASELLNEIVNIELKENELVALVLNYNSMMHYDVASRVYITDKSPKISIGFLLGVSKEVYFNDYFGYRFGAQAGLRSSDLSKRFQGNFGVFYNTADNKDFKYFTRRTFMIEFPIYGSYYFINSRRINMSMDLGLMPTLFKIDWSYGKSEIQFFPLILTLGTTLDYQLKRDIIRVRFSAETDRYPASNGFSFGYINLGVGYVILKYY